MPKLVSLVLGTLTLMTIAPLAQSATFSVQSTPHRIDGKLLVQKLAPIKKSSSLGKTLILKTPVTTSGKKIELSPELKETQLVKTACQREVESRQQFGSNERPLALNEKPNRSGSLNYFNSLNSTYVGNCSFTGKF